jgi:hypothetical protein
MTASWTVTADGDQLIVTGLDRGWLLGVIRSAQAADAVRSLTPPPAPDLDPIVAELRRIRLEQGITQRSIRDATRTQINPHEQGRTMPSLALLHVWAYVLGRQLTLAPRGGEA